MEAGPQPTVLPTVPSGNNPAAALPEQPAQQQRAALASRAGDLSKAHLLAGRERHFLEAELRVRPAKACIAVAAHLPRLATAAMLPRLATAWKASCAAA